MDILQTVVVEYKQ